jgi:hypothetical protein
MANDGAVSSDEWQIIERLLPDGWEEQARETGAFQRARYLQSPTEVLRLILFHAVSGGLRVTVAEAKAAGLPSISSVGLYLRLQKSTEWLRAIAVGLCQPLRERPSLPAGLRPRAVDSTTIQGPGNTTAEWRLHYALDLLTLSCDWHELTDAKGAESFRRTPVQPGDVLMGDRNYLNADAVHAVVGAGGHVLVRMRWVHPAMVGDEGKPVTALSLAGRVRLRRPGDFAVSMLAGDGTSVAGRVVIIKLPRPLAERNRKRLRREASKKQRRLDPRSLQAAGYVFLFTTLPVELLDTVGVASLYRFRWQIEIAFKRHKQILKLGQLPHKDERAAQSWILAKFIVALLLETLYRNAIAISPWGYPLEGGRAAA